MPQGVTVWGAVNARYYQPVTSDGKLFAVTPSATQQSPNWRSSLDYEDRSLR